MNVAASRAPVLARDEASLWDALGDLIDADADCSHALVPTMGALHEGHRALIRRARDLSPVTVVSLYVNPLQFGPGEDFDRYPRTLAADLELCAGEGVDVVFAPETLYPPDGPWVTVSAGELGRSFEGAARPGHFDGVLTVVLKLFNIVAPDVAVFGEKDYQQLALIRRMVADLHLDVEIAAVPVVRDADGLARSSRNRYLDAGERQVALALSRALQAGAAAAAGGPDAVLAAAREVLDAAAGLAVDYLTLTDERMSALPPGFTGSARLLVAGHVGTTRLIDNLAVPLGDRPPHQEGSSCFAAC